MKNFKRKIKVFITDRQKISIGIIDKFPGSH